MSDSPPSTAVFVHRNVQADGISIHLAELRDAQRADDRHCLLFLHGWPEDWSSFQSTMLRLSRECRVAAIDLPGIGGSSPAPLAGDKRTLARHVHAVLRELGWKKAVLVGHDVGGQVAFAFLKAYPGELAAAVLLNAAVPGVEPWPELERNPRLWHHGFHAVSSLPELLVTGHEARYFAYFYDTIAAQPGAVSELARQRYVEAHRRPDALRASFDWFRAARQDQRDNAAVKQLLVHTPVLYLRGGAERGLELERFVAGLREHGLCELAGDLIAGSGHFTPDEQPDALARRIAVFLRSL
jgi:pimeloyl-ACP methyl ester carboxylesterase